MPAPAPAPGCPARSIAPALSSVPSMPSVSAAARRCPAIRRAPAPGASRNSPFRPPRPVPRTVTVVSPPDSKPGRPRAPRRSRHLLCDAGMHRADVARLALDRMPRITAVQPGLSRPAGGGFRASAAWQDYGCVTVCEGADRPASGSPPTVGHPGLRTDGGAVDPVSPQDRARLRRGGRIRHGRARGDDGRVVPGTRK